MLDESVKKKVDESWKSTVEKERVITAGAPMPPPPDKEPVKSDPNFLYFISGLGMQAFAALGEIPDESGITAPPDLEQAKRLIDVIEMLARKTKGNLSAEEDSAFREVLRELRLRFVQKSRPPQ